jgi:hypothetical protein
MERYFMIDLYIASSHYHRSLVPISVIDGDGA